MFERKSQKKSSEYFDSYFEMYGVRMTLEDLVDIRETEDYMIELEQISEKDRYPIPPYLVDQWAEYCAIPLDGLELSKEETWNAN